MLDIDGTIIALLSEKPKHYTELKKELVDIQKLCTNQTLAVHLHYLVGEKRIKRTVLPNRNVIYEISAEFEKEGEKMRDYYTLESLITSLNTSTIDSRLNLVEVKMKAGLSASLEDLLRLMPSNPIKKVPQLIFNLQCDEELTKKMKLFTKLEEISTEFRNQIDFNFGELEKNIPPSLNEIGDNLYKQIISFDNAQTLSKNIANKYNFRFLLYSWFDGKGYANNILNALKKLNSLKKGHEEDILFLDEICNRQYYAWSEYILEYDIISENIIPSILDGCNVNSLYEDAFWLYNRNKFDLCALEAILVSDSLSADENISTIDIIFQTKEKIPYKIIKMTDYMKMKCTLLNNGDRKVILKTLLSEIEDIHHIISQDEVERQVWQVPSDKIDLLSQNLKYLTDELNILYPHTNEKVQNEPIFNFKFVLNGQIHDLSGTALVQGFMKFLSGSSKKKWLQKCLETGIPIYFIIPFDKLGFKYSTIL